MKKINDYLEQIDEELCSAKKYAENYLYYKAYGNQKYQKYYYDMAEDELKHAMYIHEIAIDEVKKLQIVYKPTQDMLDKWERSHAEYVEKTAFIRQMIAL